MFCVCVSVWSLKKYDGFTKKRNLCFSGIAFRELPVSKRLVRIESSWVVAANYFSDLLAESGVVLAMATVVFS